MREVRANCTVRVEMDIDGLEAVVLMKEIRDALRGQMIDNFPRLSGLYDTVGYACGMVSLGVPCPPLEQSHITPEQAA